MRIDSRSMRIVAVSGPLLLLFGCNRGNPPPSKPPLPVVAVAVPRVAPVESPGEAKRLEDVVVPAGSAVSFSGVFDAESPSPVVVQIGSDQQGNFVIDASGAGMVQAEQSGWAYSVLIENVPGPGEYTFHVLAAPRYLAVGVIRFEKPKL